MLQNSYSLLLAHDNPNDAELVRRMLDPSHELLHTTTIADARQALGDHNFDCVLIAHRLSDASPWSFISEIAASTIPVIVLAPDESEEFASYAQHYGAEDHLDTSRLSEELLKRSLRYAIGRAQARAQTREVERENKELEKQFFQSQKMEAIGRLAGGVAHDFNNLLTAIIGFSRFVLDELSPGDHRRDDLIHVLKAADRAETLTRQLLAFSRKQTIEPRILNLNELICNVERLIHRTIGEHIEVCLNLETDLAPVKVDAAQFEQVLMNMAVNSRDAMPRGGTLQIETANNLKTRRVVVKVRDTGTGITKEVQSRIFEPFFTTKDRNSGTGLGLATCYGIIKQSRGEISVESEPGSGTCFAIELPMVDEAAAPLQEIHQGSANRGISGQGRVLVVEDDDRVRALTVRMLRKNGYSTVEAATAREGRDVFEIEERNIDVLVSDIVMPDGRGTELAEQLSAQQPNLRVLLMTGYDDDALDTNSLNRVAHRDLIRKPFVEGALLGKIGDLLTAADVDPARPPPQEPECRGDEIRLLLVDDDPGTRRTYERLLGDHYDLRVLDDNPEEVLLSLERERYDLIFFDVIMPRLSGFDLAERAQLSAPKNAQRIVFLTGMQDDELVGTYAKQIDHRIVSKPLTVEKIETILATQNVA